MILSIKLFLASIRIVGSCCANKIMQNSAVEYLIKIRGLCLLFAVYQIPHFLARLKERNFFRGH